VTQQATVRGFLSTFYKLPKVVNKVRNHFGCSTMFGLELENQGGTGSQGSHWERRIVNNEIMTATSVDDPVMSEFTLALLEETGWYDVNYTIAQPLVFGKGKGCGFYTNPCVKSGQALFPEYCSNLNEYGCTYSGYKKAGCVVSKTKVANMTPSAFDYFGDGTQAFDTFADNCPYMFGFSNGDCRVQQATTGLYDEAFGNSSKCFAGNYVKTIYKSYYNASSMHGTCHTYQCKANPLGGYQLLIKIDAVTNVTCTKAYEQKALNGYTGTMTCPDPNIYCSNFGDRFDPNEVLKCPLNCSGHGTCSTGMCTCTSGWSGADCAVYGS